MTQESEHFDELPAEIVERLRVRDRAVSVLTPAVDRAVNQAARAQFAPRPSRPAARRWYVPAAAAAAAAIVAVLVTRPLDTPDAGRAADDVDGSGRVDILDVFTLARAERNDPGAVGQERIDALIRQIVDLPESAL